MPTLGGIGHGPPDASPRSRRLSKAAVVERCATILTAGGAEAEALEECANPISAMTLGEAKTIADFVLP